MLKRPILSIYFFALRWILYAFHIENLIDQTRNPIFLRQIFIFVHQALIFFQENGQKSSYSPNTNELRHPMPLTTSDVTRPARLITYHDVWGEKQRA